jgi:protease I
MKIACLLGQGFEDSEFGQPYEEFRKAGNDVIVIGTEARTELKGKNGKVTHAAEKAIADVAPDQFDALFIPGGYSPDHIRANPQMVAFAKAMTEAGKPILAICHGPQLLITAGVVRGRKLTAWKTIQGDLEKVGAEVVDQEVCVDGNLVTSRQPSDIPAFVRESLKLMQSAAVPAA